MAETVTRVETTYRLLREDEWDRVRPVFEQFGSRPPAPELSLIAVAERDGEIIGFLTVQPMVHAEPLWVAEGRTGEVYVPRLLHLLEGTLREAIHGAVADLYVFSDKPETGRMARAHGFDHTPFHVWRKRLNGEVK